MRFVTQSTLRASRSGSPARSASSASPHSASEQRRGVVGAPALDEPGGLLEVLGLDLERRQLPAVGEPDLARAGRVVADLPDRPDRVLERQIAHHGVRLDHPQDQVGDPHLHERRPLAHVRVADDHVEPAVALGVGVGLVAGVDDRAGSGGRARDALPDVLGALGDAVLRAARPVEHLAGPAADLPRDEERDQHVGHPGELAVAGDQVVLVAAVGVARASRCCS